MSKLTLNPENVAALVDQLYALTDSALESEADAIATDFVDWMDGHFDLTTEQYDYINSAPANVRKCWGYSYASTFLTRGPILFGAIPANPVPRRIKELRHNMFGNVSYNDGDKTLDGSIEVNVEFALLS
ncbi:MAG: hypothetical protein BGO31_20730 [Bacteroidetes bacterium 43-16]|uniref:hypothetical protein n=1 Tax=uncultured Dysgonomonas sp. TaxID=206096 RepID=UPI0009291162|nr:hypothetical protein [uncultured Dysgonomonas sp.]OJV55357.1 MAG: hypothetical protein BGO31_20730 [Bacteroidetes bacterium 43-16]